MAATDEVQRWIQLSAWIDSKQNTNINPTQIKVLLLLHVYYDYYCTNRLAALRTLLAVIQGHLQPLPEETQVFRALLDPERCMIGYPQANDHNVLNKLFALDCYDEDELSIRHTLVNLMAMILMGGKQSFLWTFAFQPAMLQNTFGKCLSLSLGLLVSGFGDIIADFGRNIRRLRLDMAQHYSSKWSSLRLWMHHQCQRGPCETCRPSGGQCLERSSRLRCLLLHIRCYGRLFDLFLFLSIFICDHLGVASLAVRYLGAESAWTYTCTSCHQR